MPRMPVSGSIMITTTQRRLRVPAAQVRRLVRLVARAQRRRIDQVDVLVVGRRRMAALNAAHLHRGVTDVISFDLGGGPSGGLCAQIVVCADIAIAEARRRGHPAWKELLLYITHGLLHAMGYDDADEPAARRMHRREDALLKRLGVGEVYGRAPR